MYSMHIMAAPWPFAEGILVAKAAGPRAAAYYCASMRGYSNKMQLLIENILNLTNYS